MSETSRYFVVESSVLPIVFSKVVKAKQLLANKKAKSATQASQMAGISRSVFYKYKDFVHPFYENGEKKITIYSLLEDNKGVLSAYLKVLSDCGANVLTINQSIPVNSLAPITVTVETSVLSCDIDCLLERLISINGVKSADLVAK